MNVTATQLRAALGVVAAVAETVREVGRAPRGAVYLAFQAPGLGLAGYERVEALLVKSGVVRREGDELVWVGAG